MSFTMEQITGIRNADTVKTCKTSGSGEDYTESEIWSQDKIPDLLLHCLPAL